MLEAVADFLSRRSRTFGERMLLRLRFRLVRWFLASF